MQPRAPSPPPSPDASTTDSVGQAAGAPRMLPVLEPSFWRSAVTWDGAISRVIAVDVLLIGLAAVGWVVLYGYYPEVHMQVGPAEVAGGALGAMLVFRNNAGYERWWEGRRLWGQITNSTRTLVQGGLAYGPKERAWQQKWVRWCACYCHACRLDLRDDRNTADMERLLGPDESLHLQRAAHLPSAVSYRMAALLNEAAKTPGVNRAFLVGMEAARAALVDALGACERIASTPLPRIYVFKIRRFMAVYLLVLPGALVERVGWLTPLLVTLLAYYALGLDRIAQELQTPFDNRRLNHLPLSVICRSIEANSMRMLAAVGLKKHRA